LKLLFDQNLSPRLVNALRDLYPGSVHVRNVALDKSDDEVIWKYARKHRFMIVSRDSDFRQRSFTFGAPPKIVWLRRGNCTTSDIETVLRERHADVKKFAKDKTGTFLELW